MKEHSKYKINWKWLANTNHTKKSEQCLEIEGFVTNIELIMLDINKAASLVAKSAEKLKGRDGEIKHIMEQFVISVYESTDLK